jgi:hypothetical protein
MELASMNRLSLIAAAFAFISATTGAKAACFDASKSEPRRLTGVLAENTHDDGDGLGYVLKLAEPICLTGDPNVDPETPISEVQVFATEKTRESFHALVNAKVSIDLSPPAPGKPIVLRVASIAAALDDAGAAAVTGFYRALGRGNGDDAANFIVPESRSGPLSGEAMSRFYGDLVSPLELVSVEPQGAGAFAVRYAFRSSGGQCNGRAVVKTVSRDGVDLISSIRALDGC